MRNDIKMYSILRILSVLLIISFASAIQAATLTSTLDRNPIKADQALTLTVTYDEQASSSDLSLGTLSRDFEIISTSAANNRNVSVINGQAIDRTTTVWTITLAPKRQGNLNIPSFEINGDRSESIDVQVVALTAEELAQPKAIEVITTIDDTGNLTIKPGEQVLVQIELSVDSQVRGVRGQELVLNGASFEQLSQQDGQRLENNVPRQVVIWRYAVFPNDAGEIILPKQTFTGTIGGRTSFFDSFPRGGQPVSGSSVAQSIIVEPRPDTNGQPWFPAESVEINASWASSINQIRVGEPITRTITITARGQRASAIPPLVIPDSADYKLYADQPQLDNAKTSQGIIGIRNESYAIVPSRAGQLTLAEQRISWWDTKSDVWQETILPAQTVTVLPSLNNPIEPPSSAPQQTNNISSLDSSLPPTPNNEILTPANNTDWPWKLATLLLAGIVFFQFYFLRKLTKTPTQKTDARKESSSANELQAWQDLNYDFKNQSATEIRKSLLNWAQKSVNRNITSLSALANHSQSEVLSTQLGLLDAKLYGSSDQFDANELKKAVAEFREQLKTKKSTKNSAEVLAPLYPA